MRLYGKPIPVFAGMVSLLCFSLFVGAATAQTNSAVPFLYEDARIYVPVWSQGRSLGLFILDTGVSEALLDDELRSELGLPILSEKEEHGAGPAVMKIGSSAALTLRVHRTQLQLPESQFAPLSKTLSPYRGRKISGIIGGAFLREHVVTLDITRHQILLRDPKTFRYRGNDYILAFHFVNGVPIAEGTITLPSRERLALRLLVDFGAKANLLLSEPFVQTTIRNSVLS